MQELEIKLDNLDSRDMRQLNEVYAEVKRVDGEACVFLPARLTIISCRCAAGDPPLPEVRQLQPAGREGCVHVHQGNHTPSHH